MLTVRILMLSLLEVIVPIVISCANTENRLSHLMLYNNVLYFLQPGAIDQRPDEGSDFVSAVCSRKVKDTMLIHVKQHQLNLLILRQLYCNLCLLLSQDSRSIVAANSQGFIKVPTMILFIKLIMYYIFRFWK